jgi:hypothetical protein
MKGIPNLRKITCETLLRKRPGDHEGVYEKRGVEG